MEDIEYDDRVVCVSGFPASFDQSQVLSIFGRFIPRFVRWLTPQIAIVEFENWIQAAQVRQPLLKCSSNTYPHLGSRSLPPESVP